MSKNIPKFLFYFLLIIISFIIICCSIYISQFCTFYSDDSGYGLPWSKDYLDGLIIDNCYKKHGGGFLCLFLVRLFNFILPNIIGIHPQDFICMPQGCIKGILLIILITLITKINIFSVKSRFVYIINYLFISLYIFLSFSKYDLLCIIVNHTFYRYIVPLIFVCIFIRFIQKNILPDKFQTKLKRNNIFSLILISICCFIIGTSMEMYFLSVGLLGVLILLYNICISIIDFFRKTKSIKFNLNKNFYIPFIVLYLSIFSYIISPGFKMTAGDRGISSISNTIVQAFNYTNDFNSIFIQTYFTNHKIIWIIFLSLTIISLYFAYKRDEFEKIIIPIFFQTSIIISFYSLILCGKTYYIGNQFWLSSVPLQNSFSLLLLINLSFLLSYCNYIFYNKFKIITAKNLISILLILLICSFICQIKNYIKNFSDYTSINTIVKKMNYINEKITRFYYLNKKTPYISNKIINIFRNTEPLFIQYGATQNCTLYSGYTTVYYPLVYKNNDIATKKGICFSDDALEKFYNDGGNFSKEELSDIKFNRLFDEDFILNKKQNNTTILNINELNTVIDNYNQILNFN